MLACLCLGVAVGDVGSNARGVYDVEQGQVLDLARELQQERHGLSDTAGGAHHGHLGTAQHSASANARERESICQQKVLRKVPCC